MLGQLDRRAKKQNPTMGNQVQLMQSLVIMSPNSTKKQIIRRYS